MPGRAGAVVDRHDDGRLRGQLARHVDVHLGVRAIGAEVIDPGEGSLSAPQRGAWLHQLIEYGMGQDAAAREGQSGRDLAEELHRRRLTTPECLVMAEGQHFTGPWAMSALIYVSAFRMLYAPDANPAGHIYRVR
jgi:hypothetical protein